MCVCVVEVTQTLSRWFSLCGASDCDWELRIYTSFTRAQRPNHTPPQLVVCLPNSHSHSLAHTLSLTQSPWSHPYLWMMTRKERRERERERESESSMQARNRHEDRGGKRERERGETRFATRGLKIHNRSHHLVTTKITRGQEKAKVERRKNKKCAGTGTGRGAAKTDIKQEYKDRQ